MGDLIQLPIQYDCLVYDSEEHVRIATLPGMWERTVTVGSAGSKFQPALAIQPIHICIQTESFAATGWRVGWLIGPESIIKPTLAVSTRIVFCSNSPLQEAAAAGLERSEQHNFFAIQNKQYLERRDTLVKVFDDLGMKYTLPQGSYFVLLVRRPVVPMSLRYPTRFSLCSFERIGYIRT